MTQFLRWCAAIVLVFAGIVAAAILIAYVGRAMQ